LNFDYYIIILQKCGFQAQAISFSSALV